MAKVLKSCPKSNKSPNLVTLPRSHLCSVDPFASTILWSRVRSPSTTSTLFQLNIFELWWEKNKKRLGMAYFWKRLRLINFEGSNQCDKIWQFIGLWQQLFCPILSHSLVFFVKMSKSIIFLVKSFWATFIDIWQFFLVTLVGTISALLFILYLMKYPDRMLQVMWPCW